MTRTHWLKGLVLFGFAAISMAAAEDNSITGIGPAGPIKKAHTGFKFTEGPAADADGNVYFSDIPNETIHKIDAERQADASSARSRTTPTA